MVNSMYQLGQAVTQCCHSLGVAVKASHRLKSSEF